jgi:hypothetical protein
MQSRLLPRAYKIVGLTLFSLAFLVPIILGLVNQEPWEQTAFRRQVANSIMLFGLLLFMLSREKVEDEFVDFCRLRAFRTALIAGVIYFLQDAFGTLGGNLVNSSFGVLIMQIAVYVVMFYVLKAGLFNGK